MTIEAIPPEQMPPAVLGITVEQVKAAADSGALVRLWPLADAPCRPFVAVVREVRSIGGVPFVLLDGHWLWVQCSHCELADGAT